MLTGPSLAASLTRRTGYIEGRLRIAERERARRLAKQQQQQAATGAGGPEGGGGGGGNEQELRQAAAQADAVMAELLEAEEADKVRRQRLPAVGALQVWRREGRLPVAA